MTRVHRAPRTVASRLVAPLATGLGRLLGVPLRALARRRSGKPMHPDGVVRHGVLEHTGSTPPWGVPWLDDEARDDVLVRLSRGDGLPRALPDLLGLAVRLTAADGRRIDLMFSTTGTGRLGRLLPVPRRDPARAYCSIMGYRTDAGTLRLAALGERTADGGGAGLVFALAAARDGEAWRRFGRLTLGAPVDPPDPDVRFDAVLNPPQGMAADGPMARLRAPAYAMAREGRSRRERPAG